MPDNLLSNANREDEISLGSFFSEFNLRNQDVRYKMKYIFVFGLAGALLGLGYCMISKVKYEAVLSFILEGGSKSGLGGYSNIAAQFGLNMGISDNVFQETDNVIAFVKSRNLIAKTLLTEKEFEGKKYYLAERYAAFTGHRRKWDKDKRLKSFDFSNNDNYLQDSILNQFHKQILRNHLKVEKPDKKLDILVVRTIAQDELFAKLFTEVLVENVISIYTQVQTKKETENVLILRRHVDSVRNLLNTALSDVAFSTEANPNPNPAYQRLKVGSQRRMVDVELNRAVLTELIKNLELAEITLRKETPLMQIIDRPILPLEKHKIRKLLAMIIGFGLGVIISGFLIRLKIIARKPNLT